MRVHRVTIWPVYASDVCSADLLFSAEVGAAMRRTAAYLFHFVIATLTIPIFSVNLGALLFRLTNHSPTPQQFYSDHLFSLIGCTGVLLAYLVCSIFGNREAMWVWVPSTALFLFRLIMWRGTGAGSSSVGVVEHFFAANCNFEAWRQADFQIRCSDKLFLTTQLIGGLAYSVGAGVQRLARHKRRTTSSAPIEPGETVTLGRALLAANLALPVLGAYLYFKGVAFPAVFFSLGVTFLVLNVYLVLAFRWWNTDSTDKSSH